MENNYIWQIIIAVVYVSLVIGSWIKLKMYGVQRMKHISVFLPVVIWGLTFKFTIDFVWKQKEVTDKLSAFAKIVLFFKLLVFNVEYFPTITGIFASSIASVEQELYAKKRRNEQENCDATQRTIVVFESRSYKMYDEALAA